jgi:hypothetical protein
VEGYYNILEKRAKTLADHRDPSVRGFTLETIEAIEIFACSEEGYGRRSIVVASAHTRPPTMQEG